MSAGPRRAPNVFLGIFFFLIAGNQGAETLRAISSDAATRALAFHLAFVAAALDPLALYYFSSVFPERQGARASRSLLVIFSAATLLAFSAPLVAPYPANDDFATAPVGFVLSSALGIFTQIVYATVLVRVYRTLAANPGDPARRAFFLAVAAATVLQAGPRGVSTDVNLVAQLAAGRMVPAEVVVGFPLMLASIAGLVFWFHVRSKRSGLAPDAVRFTDIVLLIGAGVALILSLAVFHDFLFRAGLVDASEAPLLLTLIGQIGAPVRWLLFGAFASVAILRYDMLGMSLASKRRAARALLGVAVLLAGGLSLVTVRLMLGDASFSLTPLDLAVASVAAVASQGFRGLVDRLAFMLYGVPPPRDAASAVAAYRVAAEQAVREGRTQDDDVALERLRGELGLDQEAARVLRAMAGAREEGPLAPRRVVGGRYLVERLVGRGGVGRVFLAHDTLVNRAVVLKEIPDVDGDESAVREARAAGAISHPNVVHVYDVVRRPGAQLLVMEYLPGATLEARLSREGPLPLAVAVPLICAVLDGLEAVHRKGIVHGDLKPANVLTSAEGTPKLGDFGSARGREGQTARLGIGLPVEGTKGFVAPEVREGGRPSVAADIYAVGVLAERTIAAPIPQEVVRVIERALAADPSMRWGSATQMRAALLASVGV